MALRRILLRGLNLSKNNPRCFSVAAFPLGKDPSSIPSQKLPQNPNLLIDDRPISLRYRVRSMIELGQLDKAAEISRLAVLERYHDDDAVFISNIIIGAMCGAKRYNEAVALFHYFFNESNIVPNMVSFNHIIKAHCDENRVEDALQLYHHARGFDPDTDTYRILTKGLVDAGRIHEAVGFIKAADVWDSVVYSYLIHGFLDLGDHHKADQLFDIFLDNMPDEYYDYDDIAMLEATFVDYWFRQGNDEFAMEIYSSIVSLEDGEFIYAKTGNTLLKILLERGKKSEAWDLFDEMIQNSADASKFLLGRRFGVHTFDSETINLMVDECFKLGNFDEAMVTFKLGASFVACYRNIIQRFCERGIMSEAEGLFEEMWARKDLVLSNEAPTFRSMINGYVKVGRVDDAQRILQRMVDAALLKVAIHEAS